MNLQKKKEFLIFIFFLIYFFLGILIYKDYGIGIEEHFQRKNGFYWFNFLLSFLEENNLHTIANIKYQNILTEYPNLPDINFLNFYGIAFDLPLAFLETILAIEKSQIYFQMRHLAIFIIFFISAISFYKIIRRRFKYFPLYLIGITFYVGSPRIFGDSFHNNKDILFLSFLTISIHYLFNFFEKDNNKNLILFCFFAALATSSRIMGVYLPILLICFLLVEFLTKKINLSSLFKLFGKIFFFYIFFLFLHYPYIWELNIFEISNWFKKFFFWMDIQILFAGEYYKIKYLPRFYLPFWLLNTIPLIIFLLSLIGFIILVQRVFNRLINIETNKINNRDFWQSINEKKDLFILLSFLSFFVYAVFLNVAMLSGWRHFYFLHIFIIYFSIYTFNYLINHYRKKISLKHMYIICFFLLIFIVNENAKFHPYQSLYFNNIFNKKSSDYQVDMPSLSRSEALNFIYNKEKDKEKIFVGNASWIPFKNGKDILPDQIKQKFVFVGQEFENADYIYTNYIYKTDEKYNKNYKIPSNFRKIKELTINNVKIYSIYKR